MLAAPPLSGLWWGFAIGLMLGVPGLVLFTYGFLNHHTSVTISRDAVGIASWVGVLRRRQRAIDKHHVREVVVSPPMQVQFFLDAGSLTVDSSTWRARDYDALKSACERFGLAWRESPPRWDQWGST